MQHIFPPDLPAHGALRASRRVSVAAAIMCAGLTGPAAGQVAENVLHEFGSGTDGGSPSGSLLADNTGPSGTLRGLYGTAIDGGNDTCADGCGMVFKFTPPKAGHTNWKPLLSTRAPYSP
jgi:hypothetical protein